MTSCTESPLDNDSNRAAQVAIVDTGGDLLVLWRQGALAINVEESTGVDGYDDDRNGFTDDIVGWNVPGNNGTPWDWSSTSYAVGGQGRLSPMSHGSAMAEIVLSASGNRATIRTVLLFDGVAAPGESELRVALRAAVADEASVVLLALGGLWTSELGAVVIDAANAGKAIFVVSIGNDGNLIDDMSPLGQICTQERVICVASAHSGGLGTELTRSNYGNDTARVAAFGGPVSVAGVNYDAVSNGVQTLMNVVPLTCVTSDQSGRVIVPLVPDIPDETICPTATRSAPRWDIEGSSVAAACVAGGLAEVIGRSSDEAVSTLGVFLDSLEHVPELADRIQGGSYYRTQEGLCSES